MPLRERGRLLSPAGRRVRVGDEALWYKQAVIYQLHVRAFQDSDGDGIGDFPGLTSRLDYLQDLGVTALWLLPFYPSPLKDDGYDIADYMGVNPAYGTLRDFRRFVNEAHRRGLRVITELVVNHTSDQHPWFQRARRAPRGSPERDVYVWSDSDERYGDVRIIFKDFERSNWTWDDVAGQYYWHRFYHHQPDLNFDNPEVHRALLRVLDFWLSAGVDGLRLDAVPYLYEREGTNCENLPETHAFLRELRAYVDRHYEGRMLLAEANMWPEDAVAYFGQGDECHMAFHFPLMPRMFMALYAEDRFSVEEILQQTPPIPPTSQWAIFLRNHDELTLEMVTDEERDDMYRIYASDARARINLGIRRRLAPLLGNDRRRIELMTGLLLSMPGTPVLYYGDEIGMGDNIYLGDRDGVRTPMQWSPDRNAGFSRCNPQQLYLPVNIDPEYHYETVNVESTARNPSSLLWWTRRLIAARQRYPVFGRGDIAFLHPENSKVLAFIRSDERQRVLVVANLSRFTQAVELDLSAWRGYVPVEVFGHQRFPTIGQLPYFFTLGPHAFHWFSLVAPREEHAGDEGESELPVLTASRWQDLCAGRQLPLVLPAHLAGRRWFGGKARAVQETAVVEDVALPLAEPPGEARLLVVEVRYTEGEAERYVLPVAAARGERVQWITAEVPQAAIAWVDEAGASERALLYDAACDPPFWRALLEAVARRRALRGRTTRLSGWTPRRLRVRDDQDELPRPTVPRMEQSNSSAFFDERFVLKLYRRLHPGINPDQELGLFLTERARFLHTPAVLGGLELREGRDRVTSLALLGAFVRNEGDAFSHALASLGRSYELVGTRADLRPELPAGGLLEVTGLAPPEAIVEALGHWLELGGLLGQRTGELHLALASDRDDPAFAPEPLAAPHYQRSLFQSLRNQARPALALLRRRLAALAEHDRALAELVLENDDRLYGAFEALRGARFGGCRIRTHGDYHLGQVLFTGNDFVIIDFEGEPARPLGQRRLKRAPLRDVAGMLRSFHYAASAALFTHLQRSGLSSNPEERARLRAFGEAWRLWVGAAFLRRYREAAARADILPDSDRQQELLLRIFLLEKALYELVYELNNRPSWVGIPLDGILRLLDRNLV